MEVTGQPGVPFKSQNKQRRHAAYLNIKKKKESAKRDERFRRKREEDKNPRLRVERRARNIPVTLDRKRVWDEVDAGEGDGIGLSIDVAGSRIDVAGSKYPPQSRKPLPVADALTASNLERVETHNERLGSTSETAKDYLEKQQDRSIGESSQNGAESEEEDDLASLMEDLSDDGHGDINDDSESANGQKKEHAPANRAPSPTHSMASTNTSVIPEALALKFPTLFQTRTEPPQILITTDINGTVHHEAKLLSTLFPNSHYIPRTRHHHNSHHFSLREISKFASNRSYTSLVVLSESRKRPSGLTVITLPAGPTFHFSITNWIDGKKLPGHGNPTEHDPELILNNFRTPLGLLAASLFRTLFPPQPEIRGRQVVTLHNQRDYIFVRRHRYIFRDRRATEKAVTDADGKAVKGAEEIRAGLQELGPRFTLKLRRVDKGIQRASGQEWEWEARMEKQRTKFQL